LLALSAAGHQQASNEGYDAAAAMHEERNLIRVA
jgi:hypothetical protein